MPHHTYSLHKKPRRLWFRGLVLVLACLAAGSTIFINRPVRNTKTQLKPVSGAAAQTPATATTHMLFVGDVFWGRTVQTKAQSSGQGQAYITRGLKVSDRQRYDAWLANFECPITRHDVPLKLQIDSLKFNCRPEYLPELAKWFTAVTVANNHSGNGGMEGLVETRENLEANGIQYFGTYDMSRTDDICEVVDMPAHVAGSDRSVSLPVAMCGFMYVTDATPTDAQLDSMRQYAKVMPVVAMPHMGIEYRPTAEDAKAAAYRRMIDAGADIVIGAHPHVIQNSEAYKGRLIAYSVGNFLFDQQTLGRATTLGLGVGVQLSISDPAATKVYEQVASTCRTYKDDCLHQLESKIISRPAIDVSYDFTCFDEAAGVPKIGSTAVCQQAERMATTDRLTGLSKRW